MLYHCDDGNAELEIEANSPEEAAREYVDGGDWGDRSETCWITVYVWSEVDEDGDPVDRESYTITLDALEPDCDSVLGHLWASPYDVLGGMKENPGVWGHGGGVKIHEVCLRCGCERITDTWAQNPDTGEQGLRSVAYVPHEYDPDRMVQDILRGRTTEEEREYAWAMDIDALWPDGCEYSARELTERVRDAMEVES